MDGEIQVRLDYDIYTDSYLFTILFRREGKYFIWNCRGNDEWEFREVNDEHPYTPTLRLPYQDQGLMKKLAEVLSDKGIKTDNDHKIQGILEATKNHLEDLRKLIFERKTI